MEQSDFDILRNDIEVWIDKSFSYIINTHGLSFFSGFGVFLDEDFLYLSVRANTVKHLKYKSNKRPDFYLNFRWNPDEWDFSDFKDSKDFSDFGKLSDELIPMIGKKISLIRSKKKREDFIVSTCITHLKELRMNGFFGDNSVLVFTTSGFPRKSIKWMSELNSDDCIKEIKSLGL